MALNGTDRARLAVLEQAVASMEEPMREIFLMHRLESTGYPEIARRLGLTVAEVQQGLADAMVHLSREMDAAEARGDC